MAVGLCCWPHILSLSLHILAIGSILPDTSAEFARSCLGCHAYCNFLIENALSVNALFWELPPSPQPRAPHDQSSGHEIHMTDERIQVVMPSW